MLLPKGFLDMVVSLKIVGRNGEESVEGTGLLYGYPRLGSAGKYPDDFTGCLVTCAHVAKRLKDKGVVGLNSKFNNFDMLKGNFRPGADTWTHHPDADIAVAPFNPEIIRERARGTWGLPSASKVAEQMKMDGVVEGTDVLMFGFPEGWRKARQDYPIVRRGVIAQIQGLYNGDHDTFLVDGSGFPGNSGGPVIISPSYAVWPEQKQKKIPGRMIGIVSDRRFSPIEVPISDIQLDIEETADLVEVIPMDKVHQTIELAMKLRV